MTARNPRGQRTALYRHFDAAGALLYVGIATHHLARLAAHMRVSEWADEIATVRIEHYPTREEAHAAERAAIRAEKPRHNRRVYASQARYANRLEGQDINPQASTVIRVCGGVQAVAEMTRRHPANVHRWTFPKERGGTGGLIPAAVARLLMAEARQRGLPLTPEHFFPSPEPRP